MPLIERVINCARDIEAFWHVGDSLRSGLEVAILYEDVPTGLRARRMLDKFQNVEGARGKIHTHMWSYEMLSVPLVRKDLEKLVLGANMLVISGHGSDVTQDVLSTWLAWWLSQDYSQPPALVMML